MRAWLTEGSEDRERRRGKFGAEAEDCNFSVAFVSYSKDVWFTALIITVDGIVSDFFF